MSKLTDELATFHTLAKRFGATLSRARLTTEEAVAVALEMPREDLRHAEQTIAHAKVFAALDPKEVEVLRKHKARIPGEEEFWNAFHGQPFAGGEIVRVQA